MFRCDLAIIFFRIQLRSALSALPFLSSVGFVALSITERLVKVKQKNVVDFLTILCYE
nr:MAG TPA: hypothetical protein [Caudoviricetes sp.]